MEAPPLVLAGAVYGGLASTCSPRSTVLRGDSMTAGEIADRFACSWPTTSRHLRKLESAGLVEVERAGREWIYRLRRGRLGVAAEWLDWFDAPPPRAKKG